MSPATSQHRRSALPGRARVSISHGIAFLLLAALLISSLIGIWTCYREIATRNAERGLEDQTTLMLSDQSDDRDPVPPAAAMPTARLLLAQSLFLARHASALPRGSDRTALLDRARAQAMTAARTRPHWGEAWVVVAYVESLAATGDTAYERAALIRSYADAPYLERAGFWRVGEGLREWSGLPLPIRNRLISEAAWLLRNGDSNNRGALFNLARLSPAYRDIFLEWRALGE